MPAPPRIDGFDEWTLLGSGGFATVFRARSASGVVAVKVSTPMQAERIEREAAVLRALGAPIAPGYHDSGVDADGRPYVVMDYVAGATLAAQLAATPGPLPPAAALASLYRLAEAVDALHARAIVHRDLKPENILVCADGAMRLIDFGLARATGTAGESPASLRVTRTGLRVGTVTYAAPEQSSGAVVDRRGDLYSLGVIAFEMLTGRPPFVGTPVVVEKDHLMARVPSASRLAPELPPAIDEVFARALAKEPAARFEHAAALVAAIGAALHAQPRVEPERPPATASTRSSSRRPVALLAARAERSTPLNLDPLVAEGAVIVYRSPDRCVLAFPHIAGELAGVRAALAAADRLRAVTAATVVHHAELLVRQSPHRTTLVGPAIDDPEAWSNVREGPRTLLTAAAAEVLGSRVAEPADLDGYFVVGAQKAWTSEATSLRAPSLRGREAFLDSLVEGAERCRTAGAATLTTILAEPGLGKTRVLDALAGELRGRGFRVLRYGALSPERADADSLTRSLLRALFDLPESPSVEDVRARCHADLGDDGAASWPAIALALGVIDANAPEAAPTLRVVGAARQSVALAIGSRLRDLAAARPLALLVDDAQWADASALDALELATSRPGALWACVASRPALLAARPGWSERAIERDTRTLEPIGADAAAALFRELLRPIEFLPAAMLEQLIERTGAIPLYIVELCQALRHGGAVRRHPDSNAWYLAPDELLHARPASLQEQIAARVLATLPPSLVAFAQLCSVVGDELDASDVDAAVARLAWDGGDQLAIGIDASIGLQQLARGAILERQGGRYRFTNPVLRRAIEAGTSAPTQRRLHEACLEALLAGDARGAGTQLRLARHRIACGATAEAADIYRGLADEARITQRWVDAEQYYSTALELHDGSDGTRGELLANRGRVRYRLGLLRESVDDLQQARQRAEARGDERTVVDVMLEEATVHDWLEDYSRSAELAAQVEASVVRLGDPVLIARWSLARARALFRRGFETRAIEPLRRALALADGAGDYDTQIVCYLLLPYALLQAGSVDESQAMAAGAIALCERVGDRVHLGVAHLNRIYLWMCLGNQERALDDYAIAVRLAQEFGLAKIASHASQIHCEILYYFGELDAAAEIARQVIALGDRYRNPNADLLILAARVLCASGAYDEAERICSSLSENELRNATNQARFLLRLVQRYLLAERSAGARAEEWVALLDEKPEHMLINENVEAFYWVMAGLARAGAVRRLEALDVRARHLEGYAVWRARFGALKETTRD